MTDAIQWNNRYRTTTVVPSPCQVISAHTYLLPSTGTALDLASGLGANALLLAQHGLDTYAWDYAETAIKCLQAEAQTQQLSIHTEVRDVILQPPLPVTYDVIAVCHFLNRKLAPKLSKALKPGGLLFYQTFMRTRSNDCSRGPKNPDFRLMDNELLGMFADLQLIVYREEGNIGDTTQGFRNEAMLIARKV